MRSTASSLFYSALVATVSLNNARGDFEPQFIPSELGCSTAHCDVQMTDNGNMLVPEGDDVGILWTDEKPGGSPYMLGCSSNSQIAVCSFGPQGLAPFLKAYNGDGDVLWTYKGVGPLASVSAPMIDDLGRVIAADGTKVVMLDNDGSELWKVFLPKNSGIPVSPVITQSGLVVVTTTGGWIVSVDVLTGKKVGELQLTGKVGGRPGYFATRNTPAVSASRENRVYSVNEFWAWGVAGADKTNTGRFFAIDAKRPVDGGEAFDVVWSLDFGSRSGASPTIFDDVFFFDGDLPEPQKTEEEDPHFFAVQDNGDSGEYLFKVPIDGQVGASAAVDPMGRGVWFTARQGPFSLLNKAGEIIEEIDIASFSEVDADSKASVATFGKSSLGNDVAMFTIFKDPFGQGMFYYVGVDISTPEVPELVFWTEVGTGLKNWSTCQGATVLNSRDEPVVIISTAFNGVVAIGSRQ